MSVGFSIYKPVEAVYTGMPCDFVSLKTLIDMEDDAYDKLIMDFLKDKYPPEVLSQINTEDVLAVDELLTRAAWADGVAHQKLSLTYIKSMCNNRKGLKTVFNDLKRFPIKYFKSKTGYTDKYISVDELISVSGWCLKKAFFRRKNTFYYADTKEKMLEFMDHYFDNSGESARIRKSFIDVWDQNSQGDSSLIFECTF